MQRNPIVANIYGYAVCFIAVLVFFIGTATFIAGAFDVVHPMAFHPLITRNIRFERGAGPADMMWRERIGMHPGAMPPSAIHPGTMPPAALGAPALAPNGAHRATMLGNARYAAIRRMTIALAMLVLAGVLFARHWRWLQAGSTS
ncbi:MAG: hypothetical protein ACP5O6_03285 [Candidatus Baltobacteraceae bacterium]